MNPATTVLVASDVHLGTTSSEQERAFHDWLEQAAATGAWIVLNGDLFDFWFEYRRGVTRGHDRTLDRLRAVVAGGSRVTLMGGNHDWWGGAFLRDEIGVEFLQDPIITDMAGRRTYLAHGDGLGEGDLGYQFMRLVLRGWLTRFAFGMLPPALGDRVAGVISKTEHRWGAPGPREAASSDRLKAWSRHHLSENQDIELILLGHTHMPLAEELHPGQWYINSGDWVYHRSYVVLEPGQDPRLEHWNGEIR